MEARYTLETHDGALIYIYNWGFCHGPKDVMERLALGEEVDPCKYHFRTTSKVETGTTDDEWLNAILSIATGERRANEVIITVYEVT